MKAFVCLAVLLLVTSVFAATPPLGTWEWVTTEETAGVFTTPADSGYTVQREFNADATYNEYRNEVLFRTGHYWVEDIEFMGMLLPALYIDCDGPPPEACVFSSSTSGLRLFWGGNSDGWPSYPIEVLVATGAVPNERYTWGRLKSQYR